MTAEVTNPQAARIINLPSGSVSATSFFSEQSGPDKLVWRWQRSQPPLFLDPSPWTRASYRDKAWPLETCCKSGLDVTTPANHLSWGSHLVLQVLHVHMHTRPVVDWLPVHGIAMEHTDHRSGNACKNKISCSCTAQLNLSRTLFPEEKGFPDNSLLATCKGAKVLAARLGCAMSKHLATKAMYLSQHSVYSVVLIGKALCKWKISVQRQEICSKKGISQKMSGNWRDKCALFLPETLLEAVWVGFSGGFKLIRVFSSKYKSLLLTYALFKRYWV